MIDIRLVRTAPEEIKQALRRRNKSFDNIIDEVIAVDEERRRISSEADTLRAELNQASKSIPQLKKAGQDTTEVFARLKTLSEKIKGMESDIAEIERRQQDILLNVPNIPHESVPEGADEKDNVEVRRWGTPRVFEFEPKAHWDIGDALGILDPQTAAKVTGARFHFLKGMGARLERAIINFYLDTHHEHGYEEIQPPLMVNRASMTATGQLPKFEEDAFKLQDSEYFLIPTAEVPVTNMIRGEILDGAALPLKYCSYTPCFRAEAGSAGRDTRGLIRQHQFDKVEMVRISNPTDSYVHLEEMTANAERVLQLLGLPYRVVLLCGGDMGFSAAKTYDIEVWLPSYNRYCEISSCSNCGDYQARRGSMRYKNSPKDKAQLVHTLNGSGVAVGRTLAAILENFQNDDGSVTIPEVLVKYMGTDRISSRG